MTGKFGGISQSLKSNGGGIVKVLCSLVFVGMLVFLLVRIVLQFAAPSLPHRLVMVKDIPLPGAMPDIYRTAQDPLTP